MVGAFRRDAPFSRRSRPFSAGNGAAHLILQTARRAVPTLSNAQQTRVHQKPKVGAFRRDAPFLRRSRPYPSSGKIANGQSRQSAINPARTGFSRTYCVLSWKLSSCRSRCSKKSRCQSNPCARAVHRFQSRTHLTRSVSGGNPSTR